MVGVIGVMASVKFVTRGLVVDITGVGQHIYLM
jgi:hypothetical protein